MKRNRSPALLREKVLFFGELVALFSMLDHGTIPNGPGSKGLYSIANIPSMGVDNEVFYCNIVE